MRKPGFRNLLPLAPEPLLALLDTDRGALEFPIRSEIFGPQRFAQHGRSLGETHRAELSTNRSASFFPRLQGNITALREANGYIGAQAASGYDISPAAEWLLDNFHLIEAQLKEVHEGLPTSYFQSLPVLLDEPLAGLPRVYGVAWAFVAHTDGAFDKGLLTHYLCAYQETRELKLSEMWALPTTLRVVLIENLRRLAERMVANKAAIEVANLCCDDLDSFDQGTLNQLLALLELRGVGRVFLAQMAQRLRKLRTIEDGGFPAPHQEWLRNALPDLADTQAQQAADMAADNLSVSNAVTSLRAIGDADWPGIIARTSTLMRLMLTSTVFQAEDGGTRDKTLHELEKLARRKGCSEIQVANALLELVNAAPTPDSVESVPGYWLQGAGRAALMQALCLQDPLTSPWRALARRAALPLYLTAQIGGALGVVTWLILRHGATGTVADVPVWLTLLVGGLMLFPASEAIVAVVNRLISESARPLHLPRLAFYDGIPPEHRALVAIPAMLTSEKAAEELAHRLHLHYLANPERYAQFALLTDWGDADTQHLASDELLLNSVTQKIRVLNSRYPARAFDAPRFLVLHRHRRFSESEQRWIGWERKRGKLEQLVAALAGRSITGFIDLGLESLIAPATPYIVTLDSDTQMPPGRLRELVGIAAHPLNQPRLDSSGQFVASGYGILQPRVATPLPAPGDFTPYHWLFAGQCGVDPYSAASSEVYQDLFGEGTFTGKGLLNVGAMQATIAGRLPQSQVLSHDLLEGSMARCATVTDITLIEDAPFHADVAASRVHRWMRGDWQLLPFLLNPWHFRLRAINRWKMVDNLRRSLVAPMSLALVLLALDGRVVPPWVALALVIAAFSGGPMLGALAGFSSSRYHLARRHFYREAGIDLARAVLGGLWLGAQLLQMALRSVDAIVRAVYRTFVSRRHLLQWTTAATAQAKAQTGLVAAARAHWSLPLDAALLFAALYARGTTYPLLALALCLVWGASPIWTWIVSQSRRTQDKAVLPLAVQWHLEGIARDTWRYFERCVVAGDNHLPPDNLQTFPHDTVAHRTSPTNIGLYLLSVASARQFGWIGTQELTARMEATLATLLKLQRHRGHFLNWYDTQTCAPLLPLYVSTVDSGNLTGHLLAVAQACLELSKAPHDQDASARAISASHRRLAPFLALKASHRIDGPIAHLLAMKDPLALCQQDIEAFGQALQDADEELAQLCPPEAESAIPDPETPGAEIAWLLADHLKTLRSAWQDTQALWSPNSSGTRKTVSRLERLSSDFETLAWQADYGFLYGRKRHLLHIGYRIAEQQLDAGFYDLLASESRLTSLLAIARGDVPVRHWAALGRLYLVKGADIGLQSWSGSMFEYLMPGLILEEPYGSVLGEACQTALQEQIDFAHARQVPWGISESAYAGRDHTLAYQYAPQGVARLALRRTPPDELVVAPYATALAAQISPVRASDNFAALERLGARAQYGFLESLDFTPSRQSGMQRFTPVCTFMAHHQGMSIVALANVLLGGVAQRWGMATAHIEAVSSLLHERVPREVSKLYAAPAELPAPHQPSHSGGRFLRDVVPGSAATEPTLVMSNGRYNVSIRANGAGCSRWGEIGVNRSRDDALRDAHGCFFYLQRSPQQPPVSTTQHPAPDPGASYRSTFHADRACFDAAWPDVEVHTTVWVSPEDDIEFRQVELRNLGGSVLELELISAFEVTLADANADESHPAFSSLFIKTGWQPENQALVFRRTPRLVNEQDIVAAHFLAGTDRQVVRVRAQADRQAWSGRNRDVSQPRTAFADVPAARTDATGGDQSPQDFPLDTGLDPVSALAVGLRIAPHSKARLTFATTVSSNCETLNAVIDKYRQPSHVRRASLMSATLTGIRLRDLAISPQSFATVQTMTTALVLSLTRPRSGPARRADAAPDACDRQLLWRFGISGDRPIILVSVSVTHGMGLLRSLADALSLWSWNQVPCDLVIVNAETGSYYKALNHEISALRSRHIATYGMQQGQACVGFHVLQAESVSAAEMVTLESLARLQFNADGRPLAHHVQEWSEAQETAFDKRHEGSVKDILFPDWNPDLAQVPRGRFDPESGEFSFAADAGTRPARPWINVLSNTGFGTQVSESGAGFSWAGNSRLNQLTAWSNDPVADPPTESFFLQDLRTHEAWSVSACACAVKGTGYKVSHGQGYTVISHWQGSLEVTATWCVDALTSVKQVQLRLVNHGNRKRELRLVGIVEWMMGASRVDRNTVHTALFRQRLPALPAPASAPDSGQEQKLTALLCTQRESSAGFGNGTAFFAVAGVASEAEDWTCDRRECFDARGRMVLPDHFGQGSGSGLDPCAALSMRMTLAPGESDERAFLLGYAESPDAAKSLATLAAAMPASERLDAARATWDTLLSATTVKTPDPLFDAMVNRWLLYQTISCRLWAKAGFYQAGGATGYRDQLQDAMSLTWTAPDMLRRQIVLCASRQFEQGDVQHWWHAPLGAGVRTHFSDDLLWLPLACAHYVNATGDSGLLDESVPFIEGAAIPEGSEDAYYVPDVSLVEVSVYEHAARTIDHSLRLGAHGLPLMGSGDWNDGMNRVGIEGRGESVWLGWFLCKVVADFLPLASARGDRERVARWQEAVHGWSAALNGPAWDGQWFKRAYFDTGEALGSHANAECRIDLIAQAWAVMSSAADPELQAKALTAMDANLVDPAAGLIKLLDPPFVHAAPSAGYIQAYPPGVRENGGQYSHAGVWALMAQAAYVQLHPQASAKRDLVYRYFTWLSPAHRADHPTQGPLYGLEPYVMAGDVCTQPPYAGRGGWSWYTGAAGWMHRAAIESIFGLRQGTTDLCFNPCLPSHWPQAELTLRRGDRTMRFILIRATADAALAATAQWGTQLLHPGQPLQWPELPMDTCFVIPLGSD